MLGLLAQEFQPVMDNSNSANRSKEQDARAKDGEPGAVPAPGNEQPAKDGKTRRISWHFKKKAKKAEPAPEAAPAPVPDPAVKPPEKAPEPEPEKLDAATEPSPGSVISYIPKPGVDITDIDSNESLSSMPEAPPVKIEKLKIPSGRDNVNTEVFYPSQAGPWPIVLLLHGSHPQRTETYYDVMAQDLAMHGYLCVFPHYYERGRKKGRGNRSDWMRTVGDAIDYAETIPNTDKTRVALIGYSLGSFLGLGYAPTDTRVTCLVAFYGGLSGCYLPSASEHMPPTLLIHGMKDRTVPARRSLEAFKSLRETRKPVSVVIYPNVGHGFTLHRRGEWDDSVSEDSWNRTLAFLNYNLNYPAWTPEMPVYQPEQFQLAKIVQKPGDNVLLEPGDDGIEDDIDEEKLQTPYLDKMFDCGDKVYVDPTGEEFAKLIKESQPPPRKKHSHKKGSSGKKIVPRKVVKK